MKMSVLVFIMALGSLAQASSNDNYVRDNYAKIAAAGTSNAKACVIDIKEAMVGSDYVTLTCDGALVINGLAASQILTSSERVTAILTSAIQSGLSVSFRSETQIYLLRQN